MGRLETEQGCKRHPGVKKLPGVCSYCLNERLSQLTSYSSNQKFSYSFSSSPTCSSTSSSTYISPAGHRRKHRRNAPDVISSASFLFNSSNTGLKKSRSMAIVAKNQFAEVKDEEKNKKKKSGFWSKLIGKSGKKKEDLRPSKSVK